MNRRDFIKTLGAGITLSVIPTSLIEALKPETVFISKWETGLINTPRSESMTLYFNKIEAQLYEIVAYNMRHLPPEIPWFDLRDKRRV